MGITNKTKIFSNVTMSHLLFPGAFCPALTYRDDLCHCYTLYVLTKTYSLLLSALFALCFSTRSCKVLDSNTLSQALFSSAQRSRVIHSLLCTHRLPSSTQTAGAVEPSVEWIISLSLISAGGRARVNPPEAPRIPRTNPADLSGINNCSRYPLEILCLREMSASSTGPFPK